MVHAKVQLRRGCGEEREGLKAQKAEWSTMANLQENGLAERNPQASAAAASESVMLASFVDACEKRDAMTADVSNAFAQATLPVGAMMKKVEAMKTAMKVQKSNCEDHRSAGCVSATEPQSAQQVCGAQQWQEDSVCVGAQSLTWDAHKFITLAQEVQKGSGELRVFLCSAS